MRPNDGESPLSGARVLVTRTPDRARDLVAALRAAGAEPVLAPVQEAVPVSGADAQAFQDLLDRLAGSGAPHWVAVTSANTVRAMARAVWAGFSGNGRGLGEWLAPALQRGLQVAAVGTATAAELEAHGVPVHLLPPAEHSNARGMARVWPTPPSSGHDDAPTVYLPQSANARPTLARGLTEHGWRVRVATAYRMAEWPSADPLVPADPLDGLPVWTTDRARTELHSGAVDLVAATAPSVIQALAAPAEPAATRDDVVNRDTRRGYRPPVPATVGVVAIGEPTRQACEKLGITALAARDPSTDALIEALEEQRTMSTAQNQAGSPETRGSVDLPYRPRRLRTSPIMRAHVRETHLHPSQLILPVFVREGAQEPRAISSMPGVVQHSMDSLKHAATEAVELGLGGFMIFGVPTTLDATGSGLVAEDGVLNQALCAVRAEVGDDILVMADLCLDEFTDHGHCGVLDDRGRVDNDATLALYAQAAVAQAEAGAHVLGPSGMMDGQVGVIRTALDEAGFIDTSVLAYSVKYASAFYGPFREAVDSSLTGDRKTYQMDPANRREAMRELELDLDEGADMVMVKPAMSYLDMVREVADHSPVPVSAYQISGEYSMIQAAAANGWIDRRAAIQESLLSIRRAGADTVLTYFATEAARWWREENGVA